VVEGAEVEVVVLPEEDVEEGALEEIEVEVEELLVGPK